MLVAYNRGFEEKKQKKNVMAQFDTVRNTVIFLLLKISFLHHTILSSMERFQKQGRHVKWFVRVGGRVSPCSSRPD